MHSQDDAPPVDNTLPAAGHHPFSAVAQNLLRQLHLLEKFVRLFAALHRLQIHLEGEWTAVAVVDFLCSSLVSENKFMHNVSYTHFYLQFRILQFTRPVEKSSDFFG